MLKIWLVSDPMCSWCWGMADAVAQARETLAARAEFDLILGGINTHGSQPIGAYGRRRMAKLWSEVQATTQASFGELVPTPYVHNSVPGCLAVEAVRQATDQPPLAYLRELQRRFFVGGEDITQVDVLRRAAVQVDVPPERFDRWYAAPETRSRVEFQFVEARAYGTNALPSVLIEQGDGKRRLLAGGYLSAEMLVELVDGV